MYMYEACLSIHTVPQRGLSMDAARVDEAEEVGILELFAAQDKKDSSMQAFLASEKPSKHLCRVVR